MKRILTVCLAALLLSAPLLAQQEELPFWANKPGPKGPTPKGLEAKTPDAEPTGIREVTAGPRTVIKLNAKVKFTTLIVLPEDEEVMEDTCGDRDLWEIKRSDKNRNIVAIKPSEKGLKTNVNLMTTSGMTYSFLLREGDAPVPDLKVYVTTETDRATGRRKYYNAEQFDALQSELIATKAALEAAEKARAAEKPQAAAVDIPERRPQFTYAPVKDEKPFHVKRIWQDGVFTYIQIGKEAREVPVVYGLADGKPELVNSDFKDGTITVKKVVDHGFLAIGDKHLYFNNTGN